MRLRRPGLPGGAHVINRTGAIAANVLAHRAAIPVVMAVGLAAGAGLRTAGLMHDGLNGDESVYSGQAAALSGDVVAGRLFGVFRAHPLFSQLILSVVYRITGVGDVQPRVVAVVAGLMLAVVVAVLALVLIGRAGAAFAFLIVCLSPYCLVVSRQFLLDGPLGLMSAITLLLVVLHIRRRSPRMLYAAAIAAGLAAITKETAVLLVPALIVAVWAARRDSGVRVRDAAICTVLYLATISPLPLSVLIAGGSETTHQFLTWQIFRPANHDALFYATQVAPAIGLPIVAFAIVGLVTAVRRHRPEDVAVVAFLLFPVAFFEIWPVKGYEYLLTVMPSITILAVEGLMVVGAFVGSLVRRFAGGAQADATALSRAVLAIFAVSVLGLGAPSVINSPAVALAATDSGDEAPVAAPSTYLAGTGGLQGGREVGAWLAANTAPDTVILTIGPTLANVIQFYGRRRALALSVSPNPLHRNPTYQPVENPNLLIRSNAVRYLVWDAYSAARTPFFSKNLLDLAKKFHGSVVYRQDVAVKGSSGGTSRQALVVIYAVYP